MEFVLAESSPFNVSTETLYFFKRESENKGCFFIVLHITGNRHGKYSGPSQELLNTLGNREV